MRMMLKHVQRMDSDERERIQGQAAATRRRLRVIA
jgi:hypothetical protein